ncbi:hypothetical protein LTR50_002735 [Elasticomyces elasticus]|nr:hypothetical protein LTR50_002735 [Elasticomyces elasticus]
MADPTPKSPPASPDVTLPDSLISTTDAISYWSSTEATITGMLGGYPQVSRIDLQSSSNFLTKLRRRSPHHPPSEPLSRIADCGAGIGRITLGLLSRVATVVDIVEPVAKFTAAVARGDDFAEIRARGALGDIYTAGLESWTPSPPQRRYDVIWNQWCLSQLTDAQLVAYFVRTTPHLTEGGWVVVKENLSNHPLDEDIFDETDSSVTRSDRKFRRLFADAGLKVVATELQKGFPKGLYPVRIPEAL